MMMPFQRLSLGKDPCIDEKCISFKLFAMLQLFSKNYIKHLGVRNASTENTRSFNCLKNEKLRKKKFVFLFHPWWHPRPQNENHKQTNKQTAKQTITTT